MQPTISKPASRRHAAASTMRSAVIAAPRQASLRRTVMPRPAAGQVRVALEGCGLCGSNLPPWEGREWFEYPLAPGAPGHEGWGIVDEVGDSVETVEPGDRVAMLSYHAFADRDVADASSLVKLPAWLDGRPFPGEPLGCAMNIFRRSDVRQGQTVAVIGIGFLGALLTQLAASAGARVVAISRRSYSLQIARENGAAEVVPMENHHEIVGRVREITGGDLCERVIEAVGLQWPLDLAGELTAERGRLIIAGYHQDGLRNVNMQLWNWRGIDVVNAHEREEAIYVRGMREAVEAVEDGRLDPFPLMTHTFDIDRLGEAMELLSRRPEGFLKTLIRIGGWAD